METSAANWPDRHPRDLLKEHGIRPRKAFGQHFLVSGGNLNRIVEVAEITPDEVVLEIGTGLGRLTARIAARAGAVVTVEIDRALHGIAAAHLSEAQNVRLLCCDFLESKHCIDPAALIAVQEAMASLDGPLKVVSNLPYSISSPAIVNLLEWQVDMSGMYLMLQREVAERLVADPGTKQYGPLTVFVDYWAAVQKLFGLPRRAFWPVPEVSSTLVKIARRPGRRLTERYPPFAATVRRLFMGRRKTLRHSLRAGWGREAADRALEQLGFDARQRVENLRTADFEAIAEAAGPPQQG
jgi:16S rRNA (adenine1518-N6/adenine1519-N6)-dimethyltransferase